MVKFMLFILPLFMVSLVFAGDENSFSADALEKWAGFDDRQIQTRRERIKASDLSATYYKSRSVKRRVYYRKPDGTALLGYVLPNSKIAPAYEGKAGCYADDDQVYPADWVDGDLFCHLPQVGVVKANPETFTIKKDDPGAVYNVNEPLEENEEKVKSRGSKYRLSEQGNRLGKKQIDLIESKKKSNKQLDSQKKKVAVKKKKVNSVPLYMKPVVIVSSDSSSLTLDADDEFGIPFGQWIQARLERVVTSADNGEIEFIINEDVQGRSMVLSRETIVFADKGYNPLTKRMDLLVTRAISPEDNKIVFRAVIYDAKKVSGLAGILERDRQGEAKAAVGKSALQIARSVVSGVTADTLVGDASESVANDLLQNEGRYLNGAPDALIRVYPQLVYLRIVESF